MSEDLIAEDFRDDIPWKASGYEKLLDREGERLEENRRKMDAVEKALADVGVTFDEFAEAYHLARKRKEDETRPLEPTDFFNNIVSFRERQLAEIPPRIWYVDGMITPGFNMIAAKKCQGKSALMIQIADAIAEGQELLGRKTKKAKVLYVTFELDEGDSNDRFRGMLPLSENAFMLHTWSTGKKALDDAERAIKDFGFSVIMFDTFLPMLPKDPDFKLNEYGDSEFYLKWRLLGKRNNAAIVASWHNNKNDRDDFFLNPIGSTGMVAQADSLITIDRKRGDTAGKLFVGGNHTKDSAISIVFENGIFKLGEGAISLDRLNPEEEKTMEILSKHPEGCTPTLVGLNTGKSDNAARALLNRLIARGKVMKISRGIYGIATLF